MGVVLEPGPRSFFQQGLHSVAAIRAAARLTQSLGLPITHDVLFEYPSVAAFAAFLAAQGHAPQPTLL